MLKNKQTKLVLGEKHDAMMAELVAARREANPLSNYGKTDLVRDMIEIEYAAFKARQKHAPAKN